MPSFPAGSKRNAWWVTCEVTLASVRSSRPTIRNRWPWLVVMMVSRPGATTQLETRSFSDFIQNTSMVCGLPFRICSRGRSSQNAWLHESATAANAVMHR